VLAFLDFGGPRDEDLIQVKGCIRSGEGRTRRYAKFRQNEQSITALRRMPAALAVVASRPSRMHTIRRLAWQMDRA